MTYQADIDWFKVSDKNTRKRCGICSKLAIKTPDRRQRRAGILSYTLDEMWQ